MQSSTLPNYAFKRLKGSNLGKSGSGIKLEARVREEGEEGEEGQHDIAKSEKGLD